MKGLPRFFDAAACRGMSSENYDRFFPEPRETGYMATVAAAVAICRTCPIQAPCLFYAQKVPDVYGIWGGRVFTPSHKRRRPTKGVEPPPPSPEKVAVAVRVRPKTSLEDLEEARAEYEATVGAHGAILARRRRPRPPTTPVSLNLPPTLSVE